MEGSDWQGGRKDGRLYRKVRAEMERVIRENYERVEGVLGPTRQTVVGR
jgi:hypothetical protein